MVSLRELPCSSNKGGNLFFATKEELLGGGGRKKEKCRGRGMVCHSSADTEDGNLSFRRTRGGELAQPKEILGRKRQEHEKKRLGSEGGFQPFASNRVAGI